MNRLKLSTTAQRRPRADRLERSATSRAPALDGPEGARPRDGQSNGRGPRMGRAEAPPRPCACCTRYNPGIMSHIELTVLGAGNMGRALIGGLLRHGMRPEQIAVGESQEAARITLSRELGLAATTDNAAAIRKADVILLAVKPQDAGAVLAPLGPDLQQRSPVVLSIAAGVRIEALRGWCGAGVPVIRAMPNRPALVGAGVTGLFAQAEIAAAQRGMAAQIMQSVGEVIWVAEEDALDVVTALSGSGPAYFFLLAEAMAKAGVDLGLPPD